MSFQQDDDVEFLPMISIEENQDKSVGTPVNQLPIIPLRNTVLFPGVVFPITVGRDKSLKAVKAAYKSNKILGVLAQKDVRIEDPEISDLNSIGTVARILKMLKMPDGSNTVILQGINRFKVNEIVNDEPYIITKIDHLKDIEPEKEDAEYKAIVSSIKDLAEQIIKLSPNIPSEAAIVLKNIDSPVFLVHFISSNLNTSIQEKQQLLEINNISERAKLVLKLMQKEHQLLDLKNQIQSKTRYDIEKQQRDYFLNQQLRTIQEELGDGQNKDIERLKEAASKKKWSKEVKTFFEKELNKLERMNIAAAEYSVQMNYLDLMIELPWNEFTKDNFNLNKSQKILDNDHYGLEKIKLRIIEYLAVLKLKGDMKSPILCFVGPPGVGKTSLGRSVAKALNRQYVRVSLGGLHDESEIRGHRKTYIGAMPGRIIQSLKKAKSSNPVFILDEIDKVGTDFRGDPSSALLEVLDPEQNTRFYDNYLEIEYDLSKVLFIATANSLNSIQPALRDRMEIIFLSGYSIEEKVQIAKKHLLPKVREAHGLKSKDVQISDSVLSTIIENYTRESGVRELDRKLAAVMRKIAKSVAAEESHNSKIEAEDLPKILGKDRYDKTLYTEKQPPGVAIGLAWTEQGGDILFIETVLHAGKGELQLTGNLGNVMKESAATALSYLKAHTYLIQTQPDFMSTHNIHIHVPEGAIPKDGPSAGITLLSALVSAINNKPLKPHLAMTGEITLRGKVLPVGGIKEKVLAAKRASIQEIILCENNKVDVDEINPTYIKGLKFHYVKTVDEVLKLAF